MVDAQPSFARLVPHLAGYLIFAAIFALFCRYVWGLPDPVTTPGSFRSTDRRMHRLGSLTYQEAYQLTDKLLTQRRQSKNDSEKLLITVKLANIYNRRQLPHLAYQETKTAAGLRPNEPLILVRHAIAAMRVERLAEARKYLEEARQLAPQNELLQHAEKLYGQLVR